MGTVDLHIHTTVSDGKFTPEEIVRRSAKLGMTVIAIADHDAIGGIAPAQQAARDFPQLRVIPCVEVSTDTSDGEVHMLGYFIDFTNEDLNAALGRFRNSREGRAQGMIEKLKGMGMPLEWSRVKEIAGDGSVGRPHVAQAMLEKGYIANIPEAFARYIGQGGPAYVEREKMTPEETVDLILRANGLPVMAHPFTVGDPETMIVKLKEKGLVGIETYYDGYTPDKISRLSGLAKRLNLIMTGGSDFHGLDENTETPIGGSNVPLKSAEKLIVLAKQRRLKWADF